MGALPDRIPDLDPWHADRQWMPPDIDLVAEMLRGLVELSATITTDDAAVRQADRAECNDFL